MNISSIGQTFTQPQVKKSEDKPQFTPRMSNGLTRDTVSFGMNATKAVEELSSFIRTNTFPNSRSIFDFRRLKDSYHKFAILVFKHTDESTAPVISKYINNTFKKGNMLGELQGELRQEYSDTHRLLWPEQAKHLDEVDMFVYESNKDKDYYKDHGPIG